MRGALLLAEVLARPWAIMPETVPVLTAVLARWAAGRRADPDVLATVRADSRARIQRRDAAQRTAGSSGGIVMLPLYGVLTQRGSMVDDVSGPGTTSSDLFAAALRAAIADDQVGGVLLDVDSPGGSVQGTGELADEVLRARQQKPIYAVANSLAASAAYWVAAQASQLFVTPGGEVGSIGIYAAHRDLSRALEMEGVDTTLISAGKFKTEGNPYGPLSPEAEAAMQDRVDSYYSAFVASVARGRAVPLSRVVNGMGEGRVVGAKTAIEQNMVDGVATFAEVVDRLAGVIGSGKSPGQRVTLALHPGARAALQTQARAKVACRQREIEIAADVGAPPRQRSSARARQRQRQREIEIAGR